MTEPPTWTMIGVVLATLVSTVVAFVHLVTRTMKHQFESFRTEIGAQLGQFRAEVHADITGLRVESTIRFETIERSFADVDRRLDRIDTRLDGVEAGVRSLDKRVGDLDRDVQALTSKQFGSGIPEV
ncbi:hypothetical protein G3T36_19425 [Diaminobutyricibacter tongyongensis]|uniref:DUF2746 domain-containing protein n=1 Tax=Leifsonia tongyongensis TaxID=1268043 RepID=A0A6L9Y4J5_9MICO|nr:hypothetical protein [Diaminobutyricibacter tongyongensis]NEN08034.1 hypothetical protein [Diaminobutyricibacter tongyongensis]